MCGSGANGKLTGLVRHQPQQGHVKRLVGVRRLPSSSASGSVSLSLSAPDMARSHSYTYTFPFTYPYPYTIPSSQSSLSCTLDGQSQGTAGRQGAGIHLAGNIGPNREIRHR